MRSHTHHLIMAACAQPAVACLRLGTTGIATPNMDVAFIPIAFIHMFYKGFIAVPARTSDAVAFMAVNPLTGCVLMEYTSGHEYEYTNVSRRAIVNLLMNPNMSLGFWVNNNLFKARTNCVSLSVCA